LEHLLQRNVFDQDSKILVIPFIFVDEDTRSVQAAFLHSWYLWLFFVMGGFTGEAYQR
jgi:hypothetical protein